MDGAFEAMPRQARVFESSLHNTSHGTSSFDGLIREHLSRITHDFNTMGTDSPPTPPAAGGPLISEESATLLQELGEYFTRTAKMWSTMTHNLLEGPHIDKVAADVHALSERHTLLTDLTAISAVDVEISRLRKIRDLTAKFSQDVEAVWRPARSPVDASSSGQRSFSGRLPLADILSSDPSHDARFIHQNHHSAVSMGSLVGGMVEQMDLGNDDASESETDDEDLFASIDMDALKQRGKGMYRCPKGIKCDKGGVDKAGNLVLFDRNSSFAQHCNKHRKPWVCDLEYCPNTPKKRRFARRDGLERHKQTVKHEPKHAEPHGNVR